MFARIARRRQSRPGPTDKCWICRPCPGTRLLCYLPRHKFALTGMAVRWSAGASGELTSPLTYLDRHYIPPLLPSNYCHSSALWFHLWQSWCVPDSIDCSHNSELWFPNRFQLSSLFCTVPGMHYLPFFNPGHFDVVSLSTVVLSLHSLICIWSRLFHMVRSDVSSSRHTFNITHSGFLWFDLSIPLYWLVS